MLSPRLAVGLPFHGERVKDGAEGQAAVEHLVGMPLKAAFQASSIVIRLGVGAIPE